MKGKITFMLLFLTISSFGQDLSNLGKSFIMKSNYNATICNAVGASPGANDILMRGYFIVVVAVTATQYVVNLPEFDDPAKNLRFVRTAAGADLYYLIPFTDFTNVCEKAVSRHSFTVGIPTIPAKLRFGNKGEGDDPRYFRFEGNVSLGVSGGYKYSFGNENQYAINGVVGFTTASVPVDSITTKGKVNTTTSAASFSPHLAIVFDIENFQFGIYTGIDFLSGEPNQSWVYRDQVWLGIGIGYNLFKVGGTDKQTD